MNKARIARWVADIQSNAVIKDVPSAKEARRSLQGLHLGKARKVLKR